MTDKKAENNLLLYCKRIAVFVLVLLPLTLLVFPVYDCVNSEYALFPANNIGDRFMAFTDTGFNGHSSIEYFSFTEGVMDLRYTLREGAETPMVFTILNMGIPEKTFDASGFDSVSITIMESTNKSILIFMKTFEPGISIPGPDKAVTLRHNSYILKLQPGIKEYIIDFDEFSTPLWWLSMMRIPSSDLEVEKFSNFVSFDMQFNAEGSKDMLHKHQRIIIERIAFNRTFLSLPNILIFVFLGFLYSGFILFVFIRKYRDSSQTMPNQKPVKIASFRKQALLRIKEFIETHYNDPDISTRMIYKALGIPPKKVFALILKEYGLSFKQLINKMRIEEAKRLLRDKDLRITDVAINVGFNEPTYFNRIFKEYEKMTPSDFRDKK